MAAILRHPHVYSFLHVPVQCGSDSVLAEMRREYTVADFTTLLDYLSQYTTVEPPIKDTPNKGHNRKNLSIKFKVPKVHFPIILIHF